MPRMETHGADSLTMAGEDYLEAIYRIRSGQEDIGRGVRSVDIAERIGVSKASVNKALTYLKESGMVEQVRYGRVTLTERGEEYARDVWHRHKALRAFLILELGVDPEVADEEACLMEHALSQDTMDRWCAYMEDHGIDITN